MKISEITQQTDLNEGLFDQVKAFGKTAAALVGANMGNAQAKGKYEVMVVSTAMYDAFKKSMGSAQMKSAHGEDLAEFLLSANIQADAIKKAFQTHAPNKLPQPEKTLDPVEQPQLELPYSESRSSLDENPFDRADQQKDKDTVDAEFEPVTDNTVPLTDSEIREIIITSVAGATRYGPIQKLNIPAHAGNPGATAKQLFQTMAQQQQSQNTQGGSTDAVSDVARTIKNLSQAERDALTKELQS